MKVTIGVDVGTQGTKAGVYTADGLLIGHAYADHVLSYPGPGRVEMDADQILAAAIDAIAAAVAEAHRDGLLHPETIGGIALSGILCGQVFVDDDLNPVRAMIPYLDLRSVPLAERAARDLEPLWQTESGTSTVDSFAAPFPLQWVRENEPDTYARIRKVLSLGPFVAARLAGLRAAEAYSDPTHMSGWILGWDAATGDWSDRQFDLLGMDRELAPRVVASDSVIGEVSPAIADRLGVPAGTPIVAGAGDVMQSNLAAGLLNPGQATDVAGTASILTVAISDMVPEITALPGMLYSLSTLPGQSFYWGYVRAGGLSLRWFRDSVSGREATDQAYGDLDRLAETAPPGSGGVLFLPYLAGGNPDNPHASGTWLGLTAASGQAELWRSVLESIAFEYASFLGEFAAAGHPVTEAMVVGGGARSAIWNQIKADIIGVPWTVPTRTDGAILANAALAAVGTGAASDLAGLLQEWNGVGAAYAPDPDRSAVYARYRDVRADLLRGPLAQAFGAVAALSG